MPIGGGLRISNARHTAVLGRGSMISAMHGDPIRLPDAPARARDAHLRLLGRLRRGLVIASVALAGGLAAFVAQAKPGKSTVSIARTVVSPSGKPASTRRFAQPPLAAPAGGSTEAPAPSLAPPPQAPAPVPAAPPPAAAVSGGS